ncbi:MAG: hypothetical protein HQK51_08805, partial [Oligoflexia bacterium]|nr:hypothetical protein [Oligoflexia bacterium]
MSKSNSGKFFKNLHFTKVTKVAKIVNAPEKTNSKVTLTLIKNSEKSQNDFLDK